MSDFVHYVRIYMPLEEGKPAVKDTGHYELQLEDETFETDLVDRVYDNPVISFGGENTSDGDSLGYVSICNLDERSMSESYLLCNCPFMTDSDVDAGEIMKAWLEENCEYDSEVSAKAEDGCDKYRVVHGNFTNYVLEKYNCFAALAEWLKAMGEDTLYNIWEENLDDYTQYIAWPMFMKYKNSWILAELNILDSDEAAAD